MSLTTRARKLYSNRKLAAQWVLAVKYLRYRGKWICDREASAPNWRAAA